MLQHQKAIVLYVEDEESDALLMRIAFERNGLEDCLQIVVNGLQAKEYLSGKNAFADRDRYPLPSIVLVDLNLPYIPGLEVLKWMKQESSLRSLPVVIFTSSVREDEKAQAMALGASAFIQKPTSGSFGDVVQRLKQEWLPQST